MSKRIIRRSISAILTILLLTPAAYASVTPGSIQFNGNQYVVTTLNFNAVPANGNFTYEFWFYLDDASRPNQGLMNTRSGNEKDGIDAQVNPNNETTGILGVSYRGRWLEYTDPGTIRSKTWYHLALVRTSYANLNIYLNGALQRSLTLDGDGRDFYSNHLIIGAIGGLSSNINARLTGNISNFRYSKSVIYSAPFTPVRTTLEATPETKVLLKTLNDSSFLDNTGSDPSTFTNNGGAVASALNQSINPLTDAEIAAAAKRVADAKRAMDRENARNEILLTIKEGKSVTASLLNSAEIDGSTEKNIGQINEEISNLSGLDKESISSVQKILNRYFIVGRISSGFPVSIFDLQTIAGPVKSDATYRSAYTVALRNANSFELESAEKIRTFIVAVEKRVSDRKADNSARISKIKASILR
jgi:hypothetical protein